MWNERSLSLNLKSRVFDTPALLARDIKTTEYIARHWYSLDTLNRPSKDPSHHQRKLLWPSDYYDPESKFVVTQNQDVHATFESFVSKLERFFGVERTIVSLRDLWLKRDSPKSEQTFDDYFKYTYVTIINWDSYANNKDFVEDYQKDFGRHPYLPPGIVNRWKHTSKISAQDRMTAVDQVSVFKD